MQTLSERRTPALVGFAGGGAPLVLIDALMQLRVSELRGGEQSFRIVVLILRVRGLDKHTQVPLYIFAQTDGVKGRDVPRIG